MSSQEYKQLSEQITRLEHAVNKLTQTMLPTEATATPVEQVIADAAGMSTAEKVQHYKNAFGRKRRNLKRSTSK